jgi:hypothetical protein
MDPKGAKKGPMDSRKSSSGCTGQQQITKMDNQQVPRNTQKTHREKVARHGSKGCQKGTDGQQKKLQWMRWTTTNYPNGHPSGFQGTLKRSTNSGHY